MSDSKFSISMDKSGVERSGWIVSSIVGLKGLYIINCDVYRTQSDLNVKSVYPSLIVPAFWFISWPQSVDILSGKGENMRMTVDSVLYIYDCWCTFSIFIALTHSLAPICDGDIKASTHVWASLWISIIAGLHMVIVFLVVHISGLYKNVLPAGSTATYLFSRFKVAYILSVVLCANGIDFI